MRAFQYKAGVLYQLVAELLRVIFLNAPAHVLLEGLLSACPPQFLSRHVSRGILEDDASPFRDKLIQDARLILERPQSLPPRPGWTPRGPKGR